MYHQLEMIKSHEVFPGFHGRFVHSDKMTLAFWEIQKGSSVPEHDHFHEQVVNMLEVEFELVVDGVPRVLSHGMVVIIPSHVRHSGTAITDCKILDVFSPVREDYVFK